MSLICGDIHGNHEKAKAFLEYRKDEEHIFLGDYMDEWEAPDEIIYETAKMIFESDAITLCGNHELHYLSNAHGFMRCSGFRTNPIFCHLVNAYKDRLKGAVVRDGYLIVHGGLSKYHGRSFDTVDAACAWINRDLDQYINSPVIPESLSHIFDIGYGRGGWQQVSGPFWLTYGREKYDTRFNQVVGHTEGRGVRISRSQNKDTIVVCLDTPLFRCFDTATGAVEDFGRGKPE